MSPSPGAGVPDAFDGEAQVSLESSAETAWHGPEPRRRGIFVTLEGIEGSGKTTQILALADALRGRGETVVVTREPGGTSFGRRLREVLLDPSGRPPAPFAELLLYVADRVQHVNEVVAPALARGAIVLCDRFLDATVAYQGIARGLGTEAVLALHRKPPLDLRPHRTILLDLDPELGIARARARNAELDLARAEGRFEAEPLDFHRRVREAYLDLAAAEPFRFRIVAAEGDAEAVGARIRDLLTDLIPSLDDEDAP